MKRPSFRVFLQNLYSFFVYDSHQYDLENRNKIIQFQKHEKLLQIKLQMLDWLFMEKNRDVSDKNKNGSRLYENIDNQLFTFFLSSDYDGLVRFPYNQIKTVGEIKAGRDKHLNLPFVLHKGKRLYYPSEYSLDDCVDAYRFLIEQDQILESGYLEKAPHCYQLEQFKVEKGDVLLDGGAAEGLFTLELIDEVSQAYIVEADAKWLPALRATFAPYADKVKIINKFLSDTIDDRNTTIFEVLSKQKGQCFVKMDIEGAEPKVIKGSAGFLRSRDNIKLSCCSYHYNDDAETMARLFDEIGYWHEFSDGWLFFAEYDSPKPPFFRKVLIRARK